MLSGFWPTQAMPRQPTQTWCIGELVQHVSAPHIRVVCVVGQQQCPVFENGGLYVSLYRVVCINNVILNRSTRQLGAQHHLHGGIMFCFLACYCYDTMYAFGEANQHPSHCSRWQRHPCLLTPLATSVRLKIRSHKLGTWAFFFYPQSGKIRERALYPPLPSSYY